MDSRARGLFERRHSFDPLAGAPAPRGPRADDPAVVARIAESIADRVNRSTPDSVVRFEALTGTLKLLHKS
jgi:hypothetical protein